jgi:hypothetical protein
MKSRFLEFDREIGVTFGDKNSPFCHTCANSDWLWLGRRRRDPRCDRFSKSQPVNQRMMRPSGDDRSGEDELTIRSRVRSRCRVQAEDRVLAPTNFYVYIDCVSLDLATHKSFNLTLMKPDFQRFSAPHDKVSNDLSWSKKSTSRLSIKVLIQKRLEERLALLSKKVSIVKCLMFLESST